MDLPNLSKLQSNHRKSAVALAENVRSMVDRFGIERVGFLTLTFKDPVKCPEEAQRRYHSLRSHVLKPRYGDVIRVFERQRSGRIHYHLLVALPADIRTGANFTEFENGVYSSANALLRAEWSFWRSTAQKYGFGRVELLPVKSTAEGIGRYVGKYISKHIDHRIGADKGVRLVEYTRASRTWTTRFAWNTPQAKLWRKRVARLAGLLGVADEAGLASVLGDHWAYRYYPQIRRMIVEYADDEEARIDSCHKGDEALFVEKMRSLGIPFLEDAAVLTAEILRDSLARRKPESRKVPAHEYHAMMERRIRAGMRARSAKSPLGVESQQLLAAGPSWEGEPAFGPERKQRGSKTAKRMGYSTTSFVASS